jgi:RNA polymerase sigma factor (sigma-70 family)
MSAEIEHPPGDSISARRCARTVARLASLYEWTLSDSAAARLTAELEQATAGVEAADDKLLDQTCCRLHFGSLYEGLQAGGAAAETALAELYSVAWFESGESSAAQQVRYGGYLYRGALATLRRRLVARGIDVDDLQQFAADAAGRALTAVAARFRDCRDPDAFWGWTARVAERAALDELRSGRLTGGSSVHARSLDQIQEAGGEASAGKDGEERQVNAIAVRTELLRKCRLGKLSDDQREALVRSFWRDEKPREIAEALTTKRGATVTAAQVSLWKHRGLQIMEANLRERGVVED